MCFSYLESTLIHQATQSCSAIFMMIPNQMGKIIGKSIIIIDFPIILTTVLYFYIRRILKFFIVFSDIDLKVAAKFFGTKFACGSSVTGDDEIVIQGDVKDDLFDIIPEKWPEVGTIGTNNYYRCNPPSQMWLELCSGRI